MKEKQKKEQQWKFYKVARRGKRRRAVEWEVKMMPWGESG